MMKKWGKALREKEMQIAIEQRKNPETVEISGFSGTSGDTELFEKPSNINGFRASEQKNILYIPPH